MANAKALDGLPLFAGLSRSDRELLAQNLDEISFAAGATLITQGASNHTFFVVANGEVEISVSGEPRRTLGRGDFFGEISMGDRRWATASAVTKTPVDALVMSHQQFGAFSGLRPVLARLKEAQDARLEADQQRG